MRAYHLERSRTYPAGPARAFDEVMPVPLPTILGQRVGLIPGVVEVLGPDEGEWGTVGQTRTVVTADRSTAVEMLLEVERPSHFSYRLQDLTGPMKLLASSIEGRWAFEQAGTGVRITWSWDLVPASAAAARAMPLVRRSWQRFAAQALEGIEDLLLPRD